MKNLIFCLIATLSLTGCWIGRHSTLNSHSNTSSTIARVDLNKANFKVVGYAKGSAQCTYILWYGGMKRDALLENARADMFKDANLVGESRVILNENIDIRHGYGFFKRTVLVTVSGYVYEFKE